MKLNGIKGIALVGIVALLLMTSVAAATGGGEVDVGEYNWDARYWWEAPPLTHYEREQVRGIMVEIFDRYFGIDVSAMSPAEFEEVGLSIGSEKMLRLFGQYATQRGFEVPAGIRVPREKFILPAAVTYWWELVEPQYREERIAKFEEVFEEMFPGVNVRNMTPEEIDYLLINPPAPPLRLGSIEGEMPGSIIVIYGRARTYNDEMKIRKWHDRLCELERLLCCAMARGEGLLGVKALDIIISSPWAHPTGYLWVKLNGNKIGIDEALVVAGKIYAAISEIAKTLDMEDVPVAFSLVELRVASSVAVEPCDRAIPDNATIKATVPGRRTRIRPIVGGIMMQIWYQYHCNLRRQALTATTGFAVRRPIRFWWDDIDYVIPGHLGAPAYRPAPTPVNARVYQYRAIRGTRGERYRAGTVRDVGLERYADVARVAISNRDVTPYIHVGDRKEPVRSATEPRVGNLIRMSGISSDVTRGRVIRTGVRLRHPTGITLYNQVRASYRAAGGDSGGPVFFVYFRPGADGVSIAGIQWGVAHCRRTGRFLHSYFSPVSGIEAEFPGWYVYYRK